MTAATSLATPAVGWRWSRFATLGVDDLYDALALRLQVFGVEQDCPYQDIDGIDRQAWHLLGRGEDGTLLAYLRVVDAGVKYAEPSIGRVIVRAGVRRTGLGRALVREGLAGCARLHPGAGNRISAQQRLQRFYEDFGWIAHGEPYAEDGIPHVQMLRPADAQPSRAAG